MDPKARTHRLIFRGLSAESADSTANFLIAGRLPVLNMFNISTPIQLADYCRLWTANQSNQSGL